jgi:hypothetical protein
LEQITHITVSGKILKGRTWNKEHVLQRQRKFSRDVFGTKNYIITAPGKMLKESIWNKERILQCRGKFSRDVFGTNNVYYSAGENSQGTIWEKEHI